MKTHDESNEAAADGLGPGAEVGPYRLVRAIGEGGFGLVYLAEQTEPIRRRVALKVIKAGMDTRAVVARFETERQALAMMDHPNIARVLDAGATASGRPYFVMELVEGLPLTEHCDRHGLGMKERLGLFASVCLAVHHAHQKGIIHRDIKPSNILVAMHDGEAVPKVIDFGIAKAVHGRTEGQTATQVDHVVGTPAYISPEQWEGGSANIDTRSDIYGLGVLLYELSTGGPPFDSGALRGLNARAAWRLLVEDDPTRPSERIRSMTKEKAEEVARCRGTDWRRLALGFSGDVDWIVMRSLAKDRRLRYETANELAADVRRHLAQEPVTARPPSAWYRLERAWARNRLAFVAGGVVAVALVAATGVSTWQARRAMRLLEQNRTANVMLLGVFGEIDRGAYVNGMESLESLLLARLEDVGKRLDGELVSEPSVLFELLARLGRAFMSLGQYKRAIEFETKALRVAKEHGKRTGKHELIVMTWLSQAYLLDGQVATARELADTVAASPLMARKPEEMDEELGVALQSLGAAYTEAGEPERAIQLLERAIAMHRAQGRERSRNDCAAMIDLGTAHALAGHHGRAIELQDEALKAILVAPSADNKAAINAMVGLAGSHAQLNQMGKATEFGNRAVDLARKTLGTTHPMTWRAMAQVASLHQFAGRHAESIALGEEVLRSMEGKAAADHPTRMDVQQNLAASYHATGKLAPAITIAEELVQRLTTKLGRGHPDTVHVLSNLALYQRDAGHPERELPLREEAYRLAHEKRPGHPATFVLRIELATAYMRQQRVDEALKLGGTLLDEWKAMPNPGDLNVLRAMSHWSDALFRERRLDGAVSALSELLPAMRGALGADHVETLKVLGNLGGTLVAMGRFEEGLPWIEECVRRRTAVLGAEAEATRDAARNLALGRFQIGLRDSAWGQAADALASWLDLEPGEHWVGCQLLTAEATAGREEAFHRHALALMERFAGTRDAAAAGRLARAALILPPRPGSGVMEKALDLARFAGGANTDPAWVPNLRLLKAIIRLRQGRMQEAVEAAQELLAQPEHDASRDSQAWSVIAIASQGLGRGEEARAAMAKARSFLPDELFLHAKFPPQFPAWYPVLAAINLAREASRTVGP